MQDGVFAISTHGCIGVTDVSPGAITWPARAIVPAPRILGDIPADRSLVADLRGCDQFGCLAQNSIFFQYNRILCDFGERRHRANLHAVGGLTDSLEFL